MSPVRTERAAKIALIAFYRVFRTQGIKRLRSDELAGWVGLESQTLDPSVLRLMVTNGWVAECADELELTGLGEIEAHDIVYRIEE